MAASTNSNVLVNQPVGVGQTSKDARPDTLSSAAAIMAGRTAILRACYGGTETMRAAEKQFLPQYDKESDKRYQARLASTFALNKLREAVDASSAKPFRTLAKVTGNTDADLDLWLPDIDLQGNHLHILGHQFFNNAMLDGQCHILADFPDTADFPNLAAQKAANARPFLKLIRDDQLVAAYNDYAGGDVQVTHVRIKGSRTVRDNTFKEKVINQIWVIEKDGGAATNGVVQLWEQAADAGGGSWDLVGEKPLQMLEVPFVTLYAGERESDYVTKPIFQDLAYKQIEHWISSSDQRSILAAARFPMLACSGVSLDDEDEGFEIGPYKVLYSPDAQGRWYFVEPKGTAIESGRKDLEMLELHMDIMALNPVTGTHRQYVPQNERDIQETRVHSVVHDVALSCQNAMSKAIRFMGQWSGKDFTGVNVQLNLEMSNTKDKLLEVAQLIALYEKRGISRETILTEMKSRNLLGDDFDVQQELTLMQAVDAQLNASAAGGNNSGKQTAAANGQAANGQQTAQPTPANGNAKQVPNWPTGQNRPTKQV